MAKKANQHVSEHPSSVSATAMWKQKKMFSFMQDSK